MSDSTKYMGWPVVAPCMDAGASVKSLGRSSLTVVRLADPIDDASIDRICTPLKAVPAALYMLKSIDDRVGVEAEPGEVRPVAVVLHVEPVLRREARLVAHVRERDVEVGRRCPDRVLHDGDHESLGDVVVEDHGIEQVVGDRAREEVCRAGWSRRSLPSLSLIRSVVLTVSITLVCPTAAIVSGGT